MAGALVKSLPNVGEVLCSSLSTTKTKTSTNGPRRRLSKHLRVAPTVNSEPREGSELCLWQSGPALFQRAFGITPQKRSIFNGKADNQRKIRN